MSMTKSRDRADATREAASTRRARPTGRGGPRFLPYSGVNQPSHGGTDTPTADPAGVRQASAGPARPPTDVYQPSLGANPLRRAQPRLRAGVLHPFNYTTRKYVPQAHNLPPNGGRSTGAVTMRHGLSVIHRNERRGSRRSCVGYRGWFSAWCEGDRSWPRVGVGVIIIAREPSTNATPCP